MDLSFIKHHLTVPHYDIYIIIFVVMYFFSFLWNGSNKLPKLHANTAVNAIVYTFVDC